MRTLKKILLAAAIASPGMMVAQAQAQKLASPVIAVVDAERVMAECNACKTANAQLQGQLSGIQQQARTLGQPLQTEQDSLEAALKAAGGKPDEALASRIEAFQGKQANAQRQVEVQQQTLQRNAAYVRQQIGAKLLPAIQQVSQQRGATVAIDKGSLLYASDTMDITNDVLTALNQTLTTVNTVAPPPAQPAAAAPAAAAPAASKPKPQGR